MSAEIPQRLARHYQISCRPEAISCMTGGTGLSGAIIWRVETEQGPFCLRRWPAGRPDLARLQWMHGVVRHASCHGAANLAVPLETLSGQTCYGEEGHLWELAPWLPGEPEQELNAPHARIAAAMQALARFHLAAASFESTTIAPCPTIIERHSMLGPGLCEQIDRLRHATANEPSWQRQMLESVGRQATETARMAQSVLQVESPIQPCLRDIWREHVLFEGDEVSGMIDYGAMRPDGAVVDVARLLASYAEDDLAAWSHGLAAYQQVRPLTEAELKLLRVVDHTAVVLTPVNWLTWIFLDRIRFSNQTLVQERLHLAARRVGRLSSGESVWQRWSHADA